MNLDNTKPLSETVSVKKIAAIKAKRLVNKLEDVDLDLRADRINSREWQWSTRARILQSEEGRTAKNWLDRHPVTIRSDLTSKKRPKASPWTSTMACHWSWQLRESSRTSWCLFNHTSRHYSMRRLQPAYHAQHQSNSSGARVEDKGATRSNEPEKHENLVSQELSCLKFVQL